jgi:hypothetical protein
MYATSKIWRNERMKKWRIVCLVMVSSYLVANEDPYTLQFEGLFEDFYWKKSLLSKIISPDDVILEAGAFDGTDTCKLADLVPQGKVISFEPNPPRRAF